MDWLCAIGHVANSADFARVGVARRSLARAVEVGRVIRLRRGLYGCPHLDAAQRWVAARGALLDCVSALARHEQLWTGTADATLHVRVPPHKHATDMGDARVHWRESFGRPMHAFETAPEDALLQVMSCLSPYDALAAVESALHLRYLPGDRLATLRERAPERMSRVLNRLDRRAESGLETIARLRLEDAGMLVESQVAMPGAGRIDLLVNDCLGIETDGRMWHEHRFIADRSKDLAVGAWGIPVLRLARTHILDSWPETLFAIERLLARR